MKKPFPIAGALVALMLLATPAYSQSAMVDGEVTKIDESAGRVTLRHGPIKKLDMDGMTMVFAVQDKSLLKQVKVGDKVKFDADKINGQITVTSMQKAQKGKK